MKKIRANAHKVIAGIMAEVNAVEYFIRSNNFEGAGLEPFTVEVAQRVTEQIRTGYAVLYNCENGQYVVRYRGRCKYVLTV